MRPRRRVGSRSLGSLALVVLATLFIGLWHPGERGTFWQGIEGRLLDVRFALRGPLPPPVGVAIVAFDDAAIAELDAFPPPRAALGAAVADVWASGAQAVALDFLLVDARSDDAPLASVLSRGDAVLGVAEAAADAAAPSLQDRGGFALVTAPAPAQPLPALGPTPALQQVAGLGHVTVGHGPDGALRRMRPGRALMTAEGVAHYPGLAVAVVATRLGAPRLLVPANGTGGRLELGSLSIPLDLRGTVPLDFYGPAGQIPTYSATSVSAADLHGRIVFLGATAVGFGDQHATPFDAALPGVEVHATFAANLLTGRHLRRDSAAWLGSVALALAAAAGGFAAAGLTRPLAAIAATALAAGLVMAGLQAAFMAGWWLDATTVLLSLALGAAAGAGVQRVEQRRRAMNLARYQSPTLVEALATEAEPLRHRPPQRAVVLFADVAGFTTHSERLGPQRTVAFLSMFHHLIEQATERSGGMTAHFAGDGALVVFGVPEASAQDAEQALRFIETLYASVRACPDWPDLGLRVGGHVGPVQLGVLGGDRQRHVSVSGDIVNAASRLQEFARSCGASLALSDPLVTSTPMTRRWVERAGMKRMEPQRLRGRAAREEVWVGEPPAAGAS